jgi:hypothetical protein
MKRLALAAAMAIALLPVRAAAQCTVPMPAQPPPGQPAPPSGDPGLAPTDPGMPAQPAQPAQQIPAREAGFGRNDPRGMPQIDQSDRNRMTDQQRNNRNDPRGMPAITPEDIARERANAEIESRRRHDNVQPLRPGVDIPTEEQAREMQRRSADLQRQAEENFRRAAELDARTANSLRESMERSRQLFQGALDRGLQAANIALQAWRILHPSDHTCLSSTSPSTMPIVPSMCAGSDGCAACYSEAYSRLDRSRGNLEKLRCIYNWNKEYSVRAMSFGDNVSSIHGISGLAWQQERRKIERAVDQLGVSYDQKYRELLGYVREDLGQISACEARFFGNPDWGTRYGFMFYGFLEDRYRR